MLPFAIGPYLAGLIMENYNPNWLWYACCVCGLLATTGFLILHRIRTSAQESRGAPTVKQLA
jgi:bacteriorhodopsin